MRPPLVIYKTSHEYKKHFINKYCSLQIETFDGYQVKFYEDMFEHAFYESSNRRGIKDVFSQKRAERIDWIESVLKDENAELYMGYDNKNKTNDNNRRVAIISEDDYVVIIKIIKDLKAKFITAYVADSPHTALAIRKNPKWVKNKATDSGSVAETSIHPKL
ncbi:hypothetical protein [Hathewaya massiliensis]|uniref:hypothetical protein n=1 Tax=Hathewaya massiliensis TaxID=1964382 RepID=UPI00115AA144|nr:hypothetical protein [Hathewaya massiliensis]